jgi:hypothetical protein
MRNSGKAPTTIVWLICLVLYIIAMVAHFRVTPVPAQLAYGSWMVGFGLLLIACRVRGL